MEEIYQKVISFTYFFFLTHEFCVQIIFCFLLNCLSQLEISNHRVRLQSTLKTYSNGAVGHGFVYQCAQRN